ncbi:hypothetical protein AAC387_Pa07g0432 [Persea americana]
MAGVRCCEGLPDGDSVNVNALGGPAIHMRLLSRARYVPDGNWPTYSGRSGENSEPLKDPDRKCQTGNRVMGCVWLQIAITWI